MVRVLAPCPRVPQLCGTCAQEKHTQSCHCVEKQHLNKHFKAAFIDFYRVRICLASLPPPYRTHARILLPTQLFTPARGTVAHGHLQRHDMSKVETAKHIEHFIDKEMIAYYWNQRPNTNGLPHQDHRQVMLATRHQMEATAYPFFTLTPTALSAPALS